jgi:hypothetical protein
MLLFNLCIKGATQAFLIEALHPKHSTCNYQINLDRTMQRATDHTIKVNPLVACAIEAFLWYHEPHQAEWMRMEGTHEFRGQDDFTRDNGNSLMRGTL